MTPPPTFDWDRHPHAKAVLLPALRGERPVPQVILICGLPGSGATELAETLAAHLLSNTPTDPETLARTAGRVQRRAHPDLTWATPTGAAGMRVEDVQPVLRTAALRPGEAPAVVAVIDGADTLNQASGNRLLKTLEEPPSFLHIILLAANPNAILATIRSRCQHVNLRPLTDQQIEQLLLNEGAEPDTAADCARLANGNLTTARTLATADGTQIRQTVSAFAAAAAKHADPELAIKTILNLAAAAETAAAQQVEERLADERQLLPAKEQTKHERDSADVVKRAKRNAHTATIDLALTVLALRCHNAAVNADTDQSSVAWVLASQMAEHARLTLPLNVHKRLALRALAEQLTEALELRKKPAQPAAAQAA
jgi:DNA polymerase-3 subunit delta'